MQKENTTQVRLDKWLKVARIYKSRNEAVEAIEGGLVKLNGERTKPSKMVKIDDILSIKKDHHFMEIKIKQITTRSLSSKMAKELYEVLNDYQPPEEIKEVIKMLERQERENRKNWKETKENKKKRRELSKFKYGRD